jgi:hypothetical protein
LWPFCDSLKAVTMKTVKESFINPSLTCYLWRIKAVTMRLVLESFKSLVLTGFFWDFLWLFFSFCDFFLLFDTVSFYIAKTVTNVTILWLAKSDYNEDGYRKLQKSFFSWVFCDYLWLCLFLYFISVLNKLTYIGCCRTNNYQKHICFWWSKINSLI